MTLGGAGRCSTCAPEHRAGLHPVDVWMPTVVVHCCSPIWVSHVETTIRATATQRPTGWVEGVPPDVARPLALGLPLDGRRTRPARVRLLRTRGTRSLLEIELKEGRNRQIRRIAEALGHPVLDLQRTAIAGLTLGDLSEGCWMWLSEREWKPMLERAVPLDLPHSPCD